jgi:hypothetical protein
MRNLSRRTLAFAGVALAAVAAFLAFGVFGVHTLFLDDEVAEANPFAGSADAPAPDTPGANEPAPATETDVEPAEQPDSAEEPIDEEAAAAPRVETLTSGTFVANEHPTTGNGFTITDGSVTFLRFELFETDNGPDLNVYLRSSADPDDYIDLGDLKGNVGDQNYELPPDVDLDRYDLVDIWCVRFGVSFGSARLT